MDKKQKRKDWLKGILLVIIVFVIAGGMLYLWGYLSRNKEEVVNTVTQADKIDRFGYTLNDNVTDYYTSEFNKLKEMEDEEEIASQVAKLFVIDLYSISYKVNKYEVTSAQYFYSDKRDMHRQKVLDNFYNFVEDNSYGDRKQELPEVSNVEIKENKKSTYKLGDTKVDAYVVTLKITYVKDLGYDDNLEITLVKDGEKNISVVSQKVL